MTLSTFRCSERPELWDRVPALFAGVWPEYNLHGDVMAGYWQRLFGDLPGFQVALYDDEAVDVVAVGRSIPRRWDGTLEDLGPGLDDSIVRGFETLDSGLAPNALCALGIEVAPRHQGHSLARIVLQAMAGMARQAGLGSLLVPVRPTWKERYPLTPIERYMHWRRPDGWPLDPWIRVHARLGATMAAAIPHSSRITGTVAEWESWTQMAFPDDGEFVFPGGLTTLHVDHGADLGLYWEPNVWMVHPV